jgi:hypothetical protein
MYLIKKTTLNFKNYRIMRLFHYTYYNQILNTYITATIQKSRISRVNFIKIQIQIKIQKIIML